MAVALVTGASRGIGSAIAVHLAGAGYDVAGCYRSDGEAAEATRAAVTAAGGKAHFAQCDVTDEAAVEAFVAEVEQALGPIDLLVNNAGVTRDAALVMSRTADWHTVLDTNLTGTYLFSRVLAFRFMKRRSGRIINLSSISGIYGQVGQTAYSASKAGIIGFTKSLAKEVAKYGITVNVVAPGYIESDMTAGLNDKQQAAALAAIPLGCYGQGDDVAATVLFLAGPGAGYITGHVLQVDGGMTL